MSFRSSERILGIFITQSETSPRPDYPSPRLDGQRQQTTMRKMLQSLFFFSSFYPRSPRRLKGRKGSRVSSSGTSPLELVGNIRDPDFSLGERARNGGLWRRSRMGNLRCLHWNIIGRLFFMSSRTSTYPSSYNNTRRFKDRFS